jgi:hypothetical protein
VIIIEVHLFMYTPGILAAKKVSSGQMATGLY